jgi:hypothetical protein
MIRTAMDYGWRNREVKIVSNETEECQGIREQLGICRGAACWWRLKCRHNGCPFITVFYGDFRGIESEFENVVPII